MPSLLIQNLQKIVLIVLKFSVAKLKLRNGTGKVFFASNSTFFKSIHTYLHNWPLQPFSIGQDRPDRPDRPDRSSIKSSNFRKKKSSKSSMEFMEIVKKLSQRMNR